MKPTTVMTIKGAKACFKAGAMLGRSTCREAAKTVLVLMEQDKLSQVVEASENQS